MKFYTLIILLFIASVQVFGQEESKIKPLKIVWVADGDTLSIDQAQTRGTRLPSDLQIVVVLDPKTIGAFDGQKLEFRWYRQGPTRYYLTNSFYESINKSAPGNKSFTISTGRGSLRAGWWKVQVEAYADRKLLAYKNKQEFWINLK